MELGVVLRVVALALLFVAVLSAVAIGSSRLKGLVFGTKETFDDPSRTTPIALYVPVFLLAVLSIVAVVGMGILHDLGTVRLWTAAALSAVGSVGFGGLVSSVTSLPTYLPLRRAEKRDTGTAANAPAGATVAVAGEPDSQAPATAPFSRADALYATCAVDVVEMDEDSATVHFEERDAAFTLDDSTGPVRVVPEGPYLEVEADRTTVQDDEDPPAGIAAFLDEADVSEGWVTGVKRRYREWVVPADADGITAFGELETEAGRPTVHASALKLGADAEVPRDLRASVRRARYWVPCLLGGYGAAAVLVLA
jgi:hypothetical protein